MKFLHSVKTGTKRRNIKVKRINFLLNLFGCLEKKIIF